MSHSGILSWHDEPARENMQVPDKRVQDIGEQGLLQRLCAFCPPELMGDDAALLTIAPGQKLVVSTDTLVDGVHFSDRTTSAADVGWRAAAANLSDLAAMGADPLGITVGLSLPGDVSVAWVEGLYQGMVDCLHRYHTAIVGGDSCRSPLITVAITAFGQVSPQQVIRRSAAQPGDAIVVTGVHGASRAGLELLLHPDQGLTLAPEVRSTLIRAHQRPVPRFDAVQQIRSLQVNLSPPGQLPRSIAGMDSSDGLADAVLQLCRASQVGAVLDRQALPLPAGAIPWISESQAVEWALYGGEDFELVLMMPVEWAEVFATQVGGFIVGRTTANPEVVLHDRTGQYPDERLGLDKGFQHF